MSKAIKVLVHNFVEDLEKLVRHEILVSLSSSGPKRAVNGRAPIKPRRERKAARKQHLASDKRTPKQLEQMRAKVLAFAVRSPGQRSEDMQKAMKLSTYDIALPLRQLIAAKMLRCEGAARGRRYWVAANGQS